MRRLFHRDQPGLPEGWQDILAARSAQWALLTDDERTRLGELADDLLRTKRFEAAHGFEITDEVRTLIAGHAALLVLGLDESAYDGVGTIVVRARAMSRTAPMAGPARGVLMEAPGAVDGEAHASDGPIMVVWSSARREAANPSWDATSCSTSSATSSTWPTARWTAPRRSPTTPSGSGGSTC